MGPSVGIEVAAPAERAWDELVELSCWPRWGPTVRAARLDDGTGHLSAGARGAVQTAVGVWLPFEVDDWVDAGPRLSWSWRVGGVPATRHTVIALGPERCRLEMGVPWWAPGYLPVVALAVNRIRRRLEPAAAR